MTYVIAKETTVEISGKKELGYTLISNFGSFKSPDACIEAMKILNLPIGWVYMPLDQLVQGEIDMEGLV